VTPPDAEAEYYQAVEEFFVSRRGDPLFLSNSDWLLIRRWRRQGLPLRIVLRGIADALESHSRSWGRARPVGSLRYCEAEVEVARERWERALAIGADPATDVLATVAGFAAALEATRSLGVASVPAAADAIARLRSIRSREPRVVEPQLASLERDLVKAIRADSSSDAMAAIEARVDGVLSKYRERLPPKVFQDLRVESITRELLTSHGLPRLSLFGL
jgi:hypothetical protein